MYWAFKHEEDYGVFCCVTKKMLHIFSLSTQICDDQPQKWGEKDLKAQILVLSYADKAHHKGLSVTGDSSWEVWGVRCVCVCVCVCVCDGGLDQELFRRSGMCKGVFLRLMLCLAHRWSNLHVLSPNRPSVHRQPGFMCAVMTTFYTINRCSFCFFTSRGFLINRHRPIVLQIRPINIQARLQATRDTASCGKQIAIPLAQRITLQTFWRENSLSVTTVPRDALFNRLFAHDVIAVGLRLLSTADAGLQATFSLRFSVDFLTSPLMNNTFSFMMKAPCVFSVWSIWAFINNTKHRHLEFLLLIPMEKNITSCPPAVFRASSESRVCNYCKQPIFCSVTAHAQWKSCPLK